MGLETLCGTGMITRPVVGAHEPQALHPWQGMDTDQDHSLVLRTDICSVA